MAARDAMATPISFPLSERSTAPHADAPTLDADILVEAEEWRGRGDGEATVRAALDAAATYLNSQASPAFSSASPRPWPAPCRGRVALAVALVDDATIRRLNRDFRGIDKPTNVLAFPAAPDPAADAAHAAPRQLGDIAIAYGETAREAEEAGKPFGHHLSHLAIHGFLHLLGHDHDQDDRADEMESLERAILAELGIPDPYAAPVEAPTR